MARGSSRSSPLMNSSCVGPRHGNFLETRMGHDDGIPIPGGDAAHQGFPFVLLEIVLGRHENVRAGIEGEQFRGELAQHVVGNGEEGFAGQPKPFQFHRRGDHRVGLPGTNDMGQQAIGGLQDPPDAGPLMWTQTRWPGWLPAVTEWSPLKVRSRMLLNSSLYLRARRSRRSSSCQTQLLEAVFDFLLLVACGLGGRGIDDVAFGGGVVIIDRGRAQDSGRRPAVRARCGGRCPTRSCWRR